MTIRYRPHRGSFADSLASTVEVSTQLELVTEVSKSFIHPLWKGDVIRFVPINIKASEPRWVTHMVTVNGDAVGYSDGIMEL